MNAELRQADERFEVVSVAEAWGAAGAIDDGTLASIRGRYADDRRRTKKAFRMLFFFFTIVTGLSAWGFFAAFVEGGLLSSGSGGAGRNAVLLAVLAAAAAFGAHHALDTLKLRRFGIEEGLVYLAIGFELGAFGLALSQLGFPDRGIAFALGWNLAVVAIVAAGRWGIAGTGAFAGIGLFGALSLVPMPRLCWIIAAVPLALAARWISSLDRAARAHRRRADELAVVALVALYAAVHVSTAAGRAFDELSDPISGPVAEPAAFLAPGLDPSRTAPAPGSLLDTIAGFSLPLGWAAMTAIPILLLVSGVRRRDRLDLALGGIGLAATAATAIDALDLGPYWLVLVVAGALLVAIAFLFRARFRAAPARFVAGFTDEPLYEPSEGRGFLEIAGALAAFTPAPRPLEEPSAAATFRGQGGEFGGGGASGEF